MVRGSRKPRAAAACVTVARVTWAPKTRPGQESWRCGKAELHEDLRRRKHSSGVYFWILRLGERARSTFVLAATSQHAGGLGPASGSFLCIPHRPILEDKRANHTAGENRTRALPWALAWPDLSTKKKKAQEPGRLGPAHHPPHPFPPPQNAPQPPPWSLTTAECDPGEPEQSQE